ncbi:hypothetical protein ACP70R_018660 [Stipagrostis hirtigluma subsp. patula]
MECSVARLFWSHTKGLTGVKLPDLHPAAWHRDLLDHHKCPPKNAAVIICGMYALWTARNNRRHGEAGMTMKQAIYWARDIAMDLWNIKQSPVSVKENVVTHWVVVLPDVCSGTMLSNSWGPGRTGTIRVLIRCGWRRRLVGTVFYLPGIKVYNVCRWKRTVKSWCNFGRTEGTIELPLCPFWRRLVLLVIVF